MADPKKDANRTNSDAELLVRLREDDEDALARLYDLYGGLAFSLACRIVGASSEAEDVVQEAFLALWRQADRLDPERGTVRSYLLTIVRRRAIDLARKRSGYRERMLDDFEPTLAAEADDPVDLASLAEERQVVRRALLDLPSEQRRAIELTYFGGLTVSEMAEREDIPLGTAKSRLRLALQRMRKHIGAKVE